MTNGVFSDYEIDQMNVKFADGEDAVAMNCVGSVEEEMTAKVITKKCRGVTLKSVTKGTGEGTLTISAHVPYEVFKSAFGMEDETLASGVMGYGSKSVHKEFCLTVHVNDEDGAEKYKAYPRCVCAAKPKVTVENGAEEVAEVEMTVTVMPDTYGFGVYEALAEGLDTKIAADWMAKFTPALVQAATV